MNARVQPEVSEVCTAHPEVAAVATCVDCGKRLCAACTRGALRSFRCPACQGRRRRNAGLMIGLATVVTVAAVLAALVVAKQKPGRKTSVGRGTLGASGDGIAGANAEGDGDEEAPGPQEPGEPWKVRLLRKRLAEVDPCDRGTAVELVDELNKARLHEAVIAVADEFWQVCGEYPRLAWGVTYALQQLGRHAEAIPLETMLITDDPSDSDFWWWRGDDRTKTGQHLAAVADLRQSFANSDGSRASRFAAARIQDAAVGAGRPCEAVAAIAHHVGWLGGTVDEDLAQEVRGLDLGQDCAATRGTGSARVKLRVGDDDFYRVPAKVGGVAGTFVVDLACGTTAIAAAFARRAGLEPVSGPPVQTYAAEVLREGAPAIAAIAVGRAAAPAVDIAIVEGLPARVDGVLCLSFLWQFADHELDGDADTLRLTGPR